MQLNATKGTLDVPSLFEQNRNYVLGDPELDIIGDRDKLAQWRHKNMGPAFYKLGRKVIYRGADLNAWAEACRVDPALRSKS
ncbi:MerR family transcriptional regulator [Litoreibacter albidus]|uniref:MerR family transcriptional regulator n=1 Tax=Litoreibacter albidus TaxID=670155 RepID=UPI00373631BF